MRSIYVGDLHGGNVYSSIMDFIELTRNIMRYNGENEIIFLGDIIDGLNKYRTQAFKHYPETLNVQRNFIKWLIEYIANNYSVSRIVFVLGNHDSDFRGSLLDVDVISRYYKYALGIDVVFAPQYVDSNKMLCLHMIARRGSIGSQTGFTPSIVAKAKTMLMYFMKEENTVLKGIVTAHVHKILDILVQSGSIFILMPSFMKTGYDVGEDFLFNPSIVALDGYNITIQSKVFYPLGAVKRFNDKFYTELANNYKNIVSIEKLMEMIDNVLGEDDKNTQNETRVYHVGDYTCIDTGDYIKARRNGRYYSLDKNTLYRVIRMIEEGYSISAIARELGIDRVRISAIIKCYEGIKHG